MIKMKKLILVISAITAFAAMADEVKQLWPEKGNIKLTSGDYSITSRLANNGRISTFSCKGREFFTFPGSTQLGTLYEAPFPKEKETVLKLTVDGKVPQTVEKEYTGKEIILERTGLYGDIRIFSKYTLNSEGLTWSVRYKIESTDHKAKYFYLFTMPWNKNFTEYAYVNKGNIKYGTMTNSKKWLICDNMDALVFYAPSLNFATVSKLVTPIPVESRRHTLWDLPHFHKYFLFHKRPEWKTGYESPEYTMHFSAFEAEESNWKELAEKLFSAK